MTPSSRRNGPVADPGPFKLADSPPSAGHIIEPLLSVAELARILSVSRRWLERERAAGRVPQPDFMAGRMPRWRAETIRRWIEHAGNR